MKYFERGMLFIRIWEALIGSGGGFMICSSESRMGGGVPKRDDGSTDS